MTYISVEEYASKNNKAVELVMVHLRQGRIPYAKRQNGKWIIPEDAPWPVTDLHSTIAAKRIKTLF